MVREAGLPSSSSSSHRLARPRFTTHVQVKDIVRARAGLRRGLAEVINQLGSCHLARGFHGGGALIN